MPFDLIDPISLERSLPFYAAAFFGGYILGSVPFGLLLTRAAGLGDIRKIGSGNIGATNVLRTGNRGIALATLLFDALKGALAATIAYGAFFIWFGWAPLWGGKDLAVLAAFGAFAGHIFPVWLKFKGGKGVATFLGTMFALDWLSALAACATWLVVAAVFRISSLSALVAASLTPVWLVLSGEHLYAGFAFLMALMIYWSHRANIKRLLDGTEPRIGKKAEPPSP